MNVARTPLILATTAAALLAPAQAAADPDRQRFRIDVPRSQFIVSTETTGLSSMFGHTHKIEVCNYEGTATLVPGAIETAALELKVWAGSLRAFHEEHEDISREIDAALRDQVLDTRRYPTISFVSRVVSARRRDDGSFDVKLTGELHLHGVRRKVTVPLRLQLQAETLRAIGTLSLRQTDFKIVPFSFAGGTASVANVVTLSFDIVAQAVPPRRR